MGMGKTLSTLSLITTTLEEAHGWSRDPAGISRKCRSKATLVIVPSTRKTAYASSYLQDTTSGLLMRQRSYNEFMVERDRKVSTYLTSILLSFLQKSI